MTHSPALAPAGAARRGPRFGILLLLGLVLLLAPSTGFADAVLLDCQGEFASDPCQFCGFTDTLCVVVEIDPAVTDLRGASFEFGFDPTYVRPVSVEPWGLATGSCDPFVFWLNETTWVNTIEVDIAGLGCSYAGPGGLLRICFTGPVPNLEGSSPLVCLASDLRDSNNAMLPHLCGSTTLHNFCPVPVTRETWGGLKHRFRTLTSTYP